MVLLGVLGATYLAVGVMGAKYAHTFLIKQARLKYILLTSFYIFSIFTCLVRVLTYALIISVYFVKSDYVVGLAVRADMITSYTVLTLGIIQVLACVCLGRSVTQFHINDRELFERE